jgi:hypothetical protein
VRKAFLYHNFTEVGLGRVEQGRLCSYIGGSAGACDESILPSAPTAFSSLSLHHQLVHPDFGMSLAPSTSASTSSPNFQSIFYAALKAYEKKTKDLLAHPLAAQLQACNSPGDILAVLQDKVNELDQSSSADERLSQWLNPTINVLYSFSATIGAGVGLVSTLKSTCLLPPIITNFAGILARICHLLWYWGTPLGEHRL